MISRATPLHRPILATLLLAALLVLSSAPAGAQTGVRFDGVNDHVTFGTAAGLGTGTYTLECWFKREGAGVATSTGTGGLLNAVPLVTKGRGEAETPANLNMNYFLGIRSDGVLAADFEEGSGPNHPIAGVTPIQLNLWYHAAVTYEAATGRYRLFLNGVVEKDTALTAGLSPASTSIQHAALATGMTSTGVAAGFFNGTLDEARIWNVARTPAEIQGAMNSTLLSGTGLIARWGLDEGTGTVAGNSIGGGVSGTLVNGPLWVAGSPFGLSNALKLGASTAYVTFGNNAALGLPQFTIETWFKRDGTGTTVSSGSGGVTAYPLLTKGMAESEGSTVDMNWFLGLRSADSVLVADFEEGAGGASPGLNHPIAGVTPVARGTWHHAAATYDGASWALYLDGNLENTLAVGQPPQSASIQHAGLGVAMTSTGTTGGHFDGTLDEARVWNVARTLSQLRATISSTLSTPQPGLVARWGLDEGAGTTLASTAGVTVNGTITGAGAVFAAPAPFNLVFVPPAAPTGLTASAPFHHVVDLSWTDLASDEQSFEIERSTAGPGGPFSLLATVPANTVAYSDNGLTAGTSICYRVRAKNGGGESAWDGPVCATTPAATCAALDFAGAGTHVTFGAAPALGLPQFTIECWFRRDGAGTVTNTGTGGVFALPLVTKGRAEAEGSTVDMNWFLGIKDTANVLAADFEEGAGGATPGLNHPILGTTPITSGVWHHAAATYDGTSWRLYLDGVLDGTLAVGQPPQSASIQHAALATAMNSTGVAGGAFDGALDEVRVWDSARSLAQLRSTIDLRLDTPQPGLVARWGLDEGTGTAVFSSAGTPVTGTLVGSAYTRVACAPYDIDVTAPAVTVLAPNGGESFQFGQAVALTWTATDAAGVTGVDLFVSRSGPAGPWETVALAVPNTGGWAWTATGPGALGTVYLRVVARDAAGNEGEDLSDLPWSIVDPATPTLIALFRLDDTPEGVEVVWQAGDESAFASLAPQRSAVGAGGWTAVTGEERREGATHRVLDRDATGGRTWWYRLAGTLRDGRAFSDGALPITTGERITAFALAPVSPNPSAGLSSLSFALPRAAHVKVTVLDVQGRVVGTVADAAFAAGRYRAVWDARDAAAGLYFVRFQAPGVDQMRRLVLAR
jgi:hypothetical protein